MLIRRETLNAVLPACGDPHTRWALSSVQILPTGEVCATDGKVALVAKTRQPDPDGDFPAAGLPILTEPVDPILVDAETIKGLIAATRKTRTRSITGNIRVGLPSPTEDPVLIATDLETPQVVSVDQQAVGRFPPLEGVFPPARQDIKICLSLPVLKMLCRAVQAAYNGQKRGLPSLVLSVPTGVKWQSTRLEQNGARVPTGYIDAALGVTICSEQVEVRGAVMPLPDGPRLSSTMPANPRPSMSLTEDQPILTQP